jgi:hypothetical protein
MSEMSVSKEYALGDMMSITTRLDYPANIAGIKIRYRNEDPPGNELVLEEGQTHEGHFVGTFHSHTGPYLSGEVTVQRRIGTDLAPGVYVLESVRLITAGGKGLEAEGAPIGDRIRILSEPEDIPRISRWSYEGGPTPSQPA